MTAGIAHFCLEAPVPDLRLFAEWPCRHRWPTPQSAPMDNLAFPLTPRSAQV